MKEERATVFTWQQPKFGVDHYLLLHKGYKAGEISWTRWFSDEAVGCYAGDCWYFDRIGFFRDKVIALDANREKELARLDYNWLKDGVIYLADGMYYTWTRTKAFSNTWELVDTAGRMFFEITIGMHWFKREGYVSFHPKFPLAENLQKTQFKMLLCMGFYLGICAINDVVVVVAAT